MKNPLRRLNWLRPIYAAEVTSDLNNYVELTADHALAMAAKSDKRIAEGTAGILEELAYWCKRSVLHERD